MVVDDPGRRRARARVGNRGGGPLGHPVGPARRPGRCGGAGGVPDRGPDGHRGGVRPADRPGGSRPARRCPDPAALRGAAEHGGRSRAGPGDLHLGWAGLQLAGLGVGLRLVADPRAAGHHRGRAAGQPLRSALPGLRRLGLVGGGAGPHPVPRRHRGPGCRPCRLHDRPDGAGPRGPAAGPRPRALEPLRLVIQHLPDAVGHGGRPGRFPQRHPPLGQAAGGDGLRPRVGLPAAGHRAPVRGLRRRPDVRHRLPRPARPVRSGGPPPQRRTGRADRRARGAAGQLRRRSPHRLDRDRPAVSTRLSRLRPRLPAPVHRPDRRRPDRAPDPGRPGPLGRPHRRPQLVVGAPPGGQLPAGPAGRRRHPVGQRAGGPRPAPGLRPIDRGPGHLPGLGPAGPGPGRRGPRPKRRAHPGDGRLVRPSPHRPGTDRPPTTWAPPPTSSSRPPVTT